MVIQSLAPAPSLKSEISNLRPLAAVLLNDTRRAQG